MSTPPTTVTTTTVSTDQVRRTGNLADIRLAIVERLDRIIQLLEAGQHPMVLFDRLEGGAEEENPSA